MTDKEYGDEEFEEFINKESEEQEVLERQPLPIFLVLSLKEKVKAISSLMETSRDIMNTSKDVDLKEKSKQFIQNLMDSAEHSLEQFDLVMCSEIYDEEVEDEDEEENDLDA